MQILNLYTLAFLVIFFTTSSCSGQIKIPKSVKDAGKILTGEDNKLTEQEVVSGLKEALSIGSKNAAGTASKVDGFYKNPAIFIPFPPEAKAVEEKARQLGMGSQVDKFVMTLNRAAEEAAKEAAPIFIDAVKQMSIQDAWGILRGGDHAATNYLEIKTTDPLYGKFRPVVEKAINKVQLTKYWKPIITTYNKIPMVKDMNPDLNDYTTRKAIEGLFHLVGEEEKKIRENPGARVTELLRKVFGHKG